jgi:hypothetical protein
MDSGTIGFAYGFDQLLPLHAIDRPRARAQLVEAMLDVGQRLFRPGCARQQGLVELVAVGGDDQSELHVRVVLQPELDFGGLVLRR